jgi:CRISPR-associated protein Cmr4
MKTRLFFLHALSPLHVGVGQAIGAVDLPIMREKSTQIPIVPGSALKGVLRDEWSRTTAAAWSHVRDKVAALMGPDHIAGSGDAHAGALALGDARVLLLPVRSLVGVTAWVTCPYLLRRYAREAALAQVQTPPTLPQPKPGEALLAQERAAVVWALDGQRVVQLEEQTLRARADEATQAWVQHLATALEGLDPQWPSLLPTHVTVVADDDFLFLAETGTEIRARVRIENATRTVRDGALWYEENLPAETVLWGIVGVGPLHQRRSPSDETVPDAEAVNGWLPAQQPMLVQIGGKHTVGRGLCHWMLA